MALPSKRIHRGVRLLDAKPNITFNSARPDEVIVHMPTETGQYDFKMDAERADWLRYLLGRALNPANEPPRYGVSSVS